VSCLWSDQLSSGLYLWVLICEFIQVLFLRLIVNFQFFSSHFHVTALGPDLFSCVYLKLFTACMVLVVVVY
jgi:hypothetical protein